MSGKPAANDKASKPHTGFEDCQLDGEPCPERLAFRIGRTLNQVKWNAWWSMAHDDDVLRKRVALDLQDLTRMLALLLELAPGLEGARVRHPGPSAGFPGRAGPRDLGQPDRGDRLRLHFGPGTRTRRVGTWQTVMISTCETSIADRCRNAGARARTITIWGSPFGEVTAESGKLVRSLRAGVREHHGHAGRKWIRRVLQCSDIWPEWRDLHRQRKQVFAGRAGDNSVLARHAEVLALFDLTATIFRKWNQLPFPIESPVDAVWEELDRQSREADVPLEALRALHSACCQNQDYFDFAGALLSRFECVNDQPTRAQCLGLWSEKELAVSEKFATQTLESAGQNPKSMKRHWADRGWIFRDADGQPRRKVRIGQLTSWMVVITREGLQALGVDPASTTAEQQTG